MTRLANQNLVCPFWTRLSSVNADLGVCSVTCCLVREVYANSLWTVHEEFAVKLNAQMRHIFRETSQITTWICTETKSQRIRNILCLRQVGRKEQIWSGARAFIPSCTGRTWTLYTHNRRVQIAAFRYTQQQRPNKQAKIDKSTQNSS